MDAPEGDGYVLVDEVKQRGSAKRDAPTSSQGDSGPQAIGAAFCDRGNAPIDRDAGLGSSEELTEAATAPPATLIVQTVLAPSVQIDVDNGNRALKSVIPMAEDYLNDVLRSSGIPEVVKLEDPIPLTSIRDEVEEHEVLTVGKSSNGLFAYPILSALRSDPLWPSAEDKSQEARTYRELSILRGRAHFVVILSTSATKNFPGYAAAIPATRRIFYANVNVGHVYANKAIAHEITEEGEARDRLLRSQLIAHELSHLLGARHEIGEKNERIPPTSHGLKFLLREFDGRAGAETVGTIESASTDMRLPIFAGALGGCRNVSVSSTWYADSAGYIKNNIAAQKESLAGNSANSGSEQVCAAYATAAREISPQACTFPIPPSVREILFPQNVSAISAEGRESVSAQLTRVAEELRSQVRTISAQEEESFDSGMSILRTRPVVVVAGHADSTGSDSQNVRVSFDRAASVAEILNKVAPDLNARLCYYGETVPRCKEEKPTAALAAAANRRAVIEIVRVPDPSR